jgi:hypothetical protein
LEDILFGQKISVKVLVTVFGILFSKLRVGDFCGTRKTDGGTSGTIFCNKKTTPYPLSSETLFHKIS